MFEELVEKYRSFYPPPNFLIIVNGQDIVKKLSIQVIDVTFEGAVNESDRFSFTINDPESRWLDSSIFDPGNIVEIKMGYADQLTSMIIGEIISFRSTFPSDGTPQLEISGYDFSFQFNRIQKSRSWKNRKDSDVVKIVANEAKIKLITHIDNTETIHPNIVQKDGETNYSLIKRLATENFFDFYVNGIEFYFCKPKMNQETLTLEYRKSLISFSPELNTANQVSEVIVGGWNPKAKKEILGKARIRGKTGVQSGGQLVEKLFGKVEHRITNKPVYSQQEANALALSILNKLSVGLVRGRAECVGLPEIKAGDIVLLRGLGKKFSQKYFIENTTHSISSSRYSTTFGVRGDVV